MKFISKKFSLACLSGLALLQCSYGLTFRMPDPNNTVLGQLQQPRIRWGDNFSNLGRRYDIGYDAMVCANPEYQSNALPLFYHAQIPSKFILPPGPRDGIVVNLPEKRLFYYNTQTNQVMTFPIGVGKQGWATPLGVLTIVQKIVNPTWIPPKDVLQELAKEGYTDVPTSIPAGPQDPLGAFAMRLSNPNYLIHGTNDPSSIGTQASSGCIRLFPEDIAQLFNVVPQGADVRIVNDPYVLGWNNTSLYLVTFPTLAGDPPLNLDEIEAQVLYDTQGMNANIDWRKIASTVLISNGIPVKIANVKPL